MHIKLEAALFIEYVKYTSNIWQLSHYLKKKKKLSGASHHVYKFTFGNLIGML